MNNQNRPSNPAIFAIAVTAMALVAVGAAAQTSRVFVTGTNSNGDLVTAAATECGGSCADALEAGDALCQARADAATLGGTWVAWLSTSTVDAKDRLPPGSGPFLRSFDNVQIADDIADLTDDSLDALFNTDEFGNSGGPTNVWTGTLLSGLKATNNCSDWTTGLNTTQGMKGVRSIIDGRWTEFGDDNCDELRQLYCFETPSATVPGVSGLPLGFLALTMAALLTLGTLWRKRQARAAG